MGRLANWLIFTLFFGALPYIFTASLTYLDDPRSNPWRSSTEILFIAIAASAAALGGLWEDSEHHWRRRPGKGLAKLVMLCGVIASALLYGAYAHHARKSPAEADGLDCAAVTQWVAKPSSAPQTDYVRSILARWGPECRRWDETDQIFFRWSLWLTGIFSVASTIAVCLYPPRGR